MDDYPYAMLPPYYSESSQPMAAWIPIEESSAHAVLGAPSSPRDPASFPATQREVMNVYPSFPMSAERALEDHSFEDLPSFSPTHGFPAAGPADTERIDSGRQSELGDVDSYHTQPRHPRRPYPTEAAHALEDPSRLQHLTSSTLTQPHSSHPMNVYPSLPISIERASEDHPFPQDSSFPPTNDFPAAGSHDTERVESDPQSERKGVESDPDDVDSDSESEPEPEDYPLPADAARWISMSPTQFDREYPGGNPFVVEELSSTSEEDPESVSYVELGASALNRIYIIFYAAEVAISPYNKLQDMPYCDIIWEVLANLLKDGKIWLWVDDDEEKCADLPLPCTRMSYVKRKLSCSSLRLRKPRSPTWTSFWERVTKASFPMRMSVIFWAILTSLSVREAHWERGLADWTRCTLRRAVDKWYAALSDIDMDDLEDEVTALGDKDRRSHLEVTFKDTFRCHGHSCYSSISECFKFKCWLYLQSFLCPNPLGKDVSMILFYDGSSCQQCYKLKHLYFNDDDAHHIPPLSLLVLNDFRLRLDIDMPAWLSVLALGTSCGIISTAILSKIDDKIRRLFDPAEMSQFIYQPWVNRLPRCGLRGSVVTCFESDWREAEHAVQWKNQHESVMPSQWDSPDIGPGVWITAMYLLMSGHSDSQKMTPCKYCQDFYIRCDEWNEVFDKPVYPPNLAASVEAFCDATSESSDVSTHTCCEFRWDKHPLRLRQCYAAAYLLLHPESKDVPLLEPLQRPVYCARYNWHQHLTKNCKECSNCVKCWRLPEVSLVPVPAPSATTPPVDEMDDIKVPTSAIVLPNPQGSAIYQIPSKSGHTRETALSKDVILPRLKDHFAKLLAQYDIPIQYTNLGAPQLPWCTLPQLLRNRRLEIAGWPEDLPLPDATGKHNAKGIMGLSAKDARRLHEALPCISFRPMDKARTRPREDDSEDAVGDRPTKKAKGKGKAPAEGEKKFRLSEVQTVIRGIRVGKSN